MNMNFGKTLFKLVYQLCVSFQSLDPSSFIFICFGFPPQGIMAGKWSKEVESMSKELLKQNMESPSRWEGSEDKRRLDRGWILRSRGARDSRF